MNKFIGSQDINLVPIVNNTACEVLINKTCVLEKWKLVNDNWKRD